MDRVRAVGIFALVLACAAWGWGWTSVRATYAAPQEGTQGPGPGAPAADAGKQGPAAHLSAQEIADGKEMFQGNCGECHGVDGSGGVGPDLHGVAQKHGDQYIFSAIRNGIPGTGMAPVSSLNDKRAWEVVGYVRTLTTAGGEMTVTGDPAKGRAVFEANGCSTCHTIKGKGGDVGPELSDIGDARSPKYLHETLLDPGANPPSDTAVPERAAYMGYLLTKVVTKSGKEVTGLRVNEDSFTINLRDAGGHYYSFNKSDLKSIDEEPGRSLMPSYKNLSSSDLDNLVAYLASLKGAQ